MNTGKEKFKTMDMFEENEKHSMRVVTRKVIFHNSDIPAELVDFSNRELIREGIREFQAMGILTK